MIKFAHYSTKHETINKDNFNVVSETFEPSSERNSLNPDFVCLFASIENENNVSEWYNHCLEQSKQFQDNNYDGWINGQKTSFNVDLSKVLVIDNVNDLYILISKYCELVRHIPHNTHLCDSQMPPKITKQKTRKHNFYLSIDEIMLDIQYILLYLDSLNITKKEFLLDEQTIIRLMKERKDKEFPIIVNGTFTVKTSKQTNDFIIDVLRLLKHLYDTLYVMHCKQREHNLGKLCLERICYEKIRMDGYHGIYYSSNLIQSVKNQLDRNQPDRNQLDKNDFKIKNMSNIYRKYGTHSNKSIEHTIFDYLRWLSTDTLILWNSIEFN